jgi:hypothetical protein
MKRRYEVEFGPWKGRTVTMAVVLSATMLVGASTASSAKRALTVPPLTTKVPRFVMRLCASARAHSPIPLVCPPLVPVTSYRPFAGLSGVLLGNTNRPPVKPPADEIYLLGFNGGDSGPVYWHWLIGMGTPHAIRYWVLSDAHNEVQGKPRRVKVLLLQGRRVEIWRFPNYPAGGEFGGHVAAITRSGPYWVIASIHGYDTAEVDARMAVALARKADSAR